MADEDNNEKVLDFRQLGYTGLRRFSGFIYEEFLNVLVGQRAAQVYKEMSDNDATCGTILYVIDKFIRQIPWRVENASEAPFDVEAGEFLRSNMDDMDNSWIDTMSEIMTMIPYGYSVHELVYKRRAGAGPDPTTRSKYSDGRIGWRSLPIRSQDTIWRWVFDEHGEILGAEQMAPPHYQRVVIPAEKMLLFRTTIHKNNPEGRSIFRSAYRSWYMKKNIENIEAIGIERDLAGLPFAVVPPELLSPGATAAQKALLGEIQKIVTNVRNDEQAGVIFPAAYDANGKLLYDFKLLSTGGTKQFDVDKTIQRYDHRIAMSALADFILLGQGSSGSKAMHTDKTEMFVASIGCFLDIIENTLNNVAVPRLFGLNTFRVSDYPKFRHGDVSKVDFSELADALQKLSVAGMPLFPDETLENWVRKSANMPEITQGTKKIDQQVEPHGKIDPEKYIEIDNNTPDAGIPDSIKNQEKSEAGTILPPRKPTEAM